MTAVIGDFVKMVAFIFIKLCHGQHINIENKARYAELHVARQFLEASEPLALFLRKKNKVFRYGFGECVYQISGLLF